MAYPDGAPWGAADPDAAGNCTSCHFDHAPVRDSAALVLEGLPDTVSPGALYELVLKFDTGDRPAAGFQVVVRTGDEPAGAFAEPATALEVQGAAIRSTAPAKSDGIVSWPLRWRAPPVADSPFRFLIAASAANEDGSPFGDMIHFRTCVVTAGPAGADRDSTEIAACNGLNSR